MNAHIVKRGKTYTIVLELGKDPVTGKRKQDWRHKGYRTKKAAEKDKNRLLHELNTGHYTEPTKLTVGEWLDKWVKDHSAYLAAKTRLNYTLIAREAKAVIGSYPLQRLTAEHLEGLYSLWEAQGIAPSTINMRHGVLHVMFGKAESLDRVMRNPATGAKPPRDDHKAPVVLGIDATHSLLRELKETPYYVPAMLAATTGLRRGEVLALKWDDLDREACLLSVRRSLEEGKPPRLKEPKTKRSSRVVSVPNFALAVLDDYRKEQTAHRLLMGSTWQDNDLIFCGTYGEPLRPEIFSGGFARAARRAGFNINFHALRHGHASHLLMQGVNPKVVQERLGHSTIGMTMDTYSHVMPGMQQQVAEIANGMYEPSGSNPLANLPSAEEKSCNSGTS